MTRFITSLLFLALTMTGSVLSAQDDSKYGDTPEQQAACKENLSLYETYYKQKNYDDAYPFWQNSTGLYPQRLCEYSKCPPCRRYAPARCRMWLSGLQPV